MTGQIISGYTRAHITMDKLLLIISWTLCYFALCASYCNELHDYGRRCHCKNAREIRCLGGSLGRLPQISPDIQRDVVTLILRSNLISSISDIDLQGYNSLRKLDLRLQRTGECVIDFRKYNYPGLFVQGLCVMVCIIFTIVT